MQTRKYLYAAVGAPVLVAKTARQRAEELRSRLGENAQERWKGVEQQIDDWAGEGEKVVTRITDGKAIDDLTAKMDLDQVSEQVTKLRDQLEDLLATWRSNFRPEEAPQPEGAKAEASGPSTKPAETKASQSKPSQTKSGTTKAASQKTTATKKGGSSTKNSSAKSSGSKGSSTKSGSSSSSSTKKSQAAKAS